MTTGSPQSITLDYLRSLLNRGVDQIPVTDEARVILRKWFIEARQKKSPAPATATSTEASELESNLRTLKELRYIKTEVEQTPPLVPSNVSFTLDGQTRSEKLRSLRDLVKNWPPIRELNSLRDKLVFAGGGLRSGIVFITEAPGIYEEKQEKPLVGPAGEKLDAMLKAMGLSRNDVYITNLIKYRPALPNQLSNNRPPTPQEVSVFLPILREELQIIQPKIIVALGANVARHLLQSGDTPLSALRGQFHTVFNTPVRVTYHPSYLLRTDDVREKRKIWEDMLAVMEKAGLPISSKQRSYFIPKQ